MQWHKKIYSISFILLFSITCSLDAGNIVRAALDIGSGATKLRVAEVDLQANKIERVLDTQSFAVPYQEELSKSTDGNFSDDLMQKGIDALRESAKIAQKHGAEKVVAVATAAFRKAHNADDYIKRIKNETGIEVHIIEQALEGELAFKAVQSHYGVKPSELVVWDIGGGSLQLTATNEDGELIVYRGTEASTPFKNYVIEMIQRRSINDVNTPNPMSFKDILQAGFYAQRLTENVDQEIKNKIVDSKTITVGVGNIFGYQIAKMFDQDPEITRHGIAEAASKLAHKNDHDVGGGDYANVFVTNTLLILGFMEGLNIDKMRITDINPADGAFFHAPFWHKSKEQSSICKIITQL